MLLPDPAETLEVAERLATTSKTRAMSARNTACLLALLRESSKHQFHFR